MKILVFVLLISVSTSVFSKTEKKIIIKYNKRQKVDLSQIIIDAEVVAPIDLNVNIEDKKNHNYLYKRKNYNDRMRMNIRYVY